MRVVTIQFRRGTTAQIDTSDRILKPGEPGSNLETGELRVGNGVDLWENLPAMEGPAGPPGAGLKILGFLDDESELPETGEAGDAYRIGTDLWAWIVGDEAWENLGAFRGETADWRENAGWLEFKYPTDVDWTPVYEFPEGGGASSFSELDGEPADNEALAAALDERAPSESPILTGDPTAPTPATSDNDTSIATTAFVRAALAAYGVPGASAFDQAVEGGYSGTEAAFEGALAQILDVVVSVQIDADQLIVTTAGGEEIPVGTVGGSGGGNAAYRYIVDDAWQPRGDSSFPVTWDAGADEDPPVPSDWVAGDHVLSINPLVLE